MKRQIVHGATWRPAQLFLFLAALHFAVVPASAAVLDKQRALEAQTFWDNRDWDWYKKNIPFFECPDADLVTTYYYRWEVVTKHLTYGSPNSGYSFTEFIDRPFWSGAYGAISCPAGHQLYEVRWLRDPRYARDYSRYWFRTEGAQPRRYGCWIADGVWAVHCVHPNDAFVKDLLPNLKKNFAGWEERQFVPGTGLFWQNGHDDGMEYNITSRQTEDTVRGADGYRPGFNAYMYADALAIAYAARLAGDGKTAKEFEAKAASLKEKVQKLLWDPKREFFFPMFMRDERDKEGNVVKANTLTYQSGRFAGNPHGREEHAYIPWQFNMVDPGYESAWKFLMDREYFFADFGPSTVERHDPLFLLQNWCCWWSGQSWPYATTQTLKALANLLQNYKQNIISRADYLKLLQVYARTHRKDGRPFIAEACHPDTGSWEGHESYNHSEHYFHSGFNDLVVTGLIGLKPRADDVLELDPIAPADWPYFALDDLPYRGHQLAILWDKDGSRYHRGAGLHVLVDGKEIASAPILRKLTAKLPRHSHSDPVQKPREAKTLVNFAVNNDGFYFPKLTTSFSNPKTPLFKANDGNYWYHIHPPNRWTTEGSTNASDWVAIDFGIERQIHTAKLYWLDDGTNILAPAKFTLQHWSRSTWKDVPKQTRAPRNPAGHRANVITFPELATTKLRAVFEHVPAGRAGLTEFEAWGETALPVTIAAPPAGNLARNAKSAASFSDRFGGTPEKAVDGRIRYQPEPVNRWTSYGSTNVSDWLELDFGTPKEVGRVELYIYDDRGGVRAPEKVNVQYFADGGWQDARNQQKSSPSPIGNMINTVTFSKTMTQKLRVVFTHKGKSRSGVTEVEAWPE
jgi:hypothetical protein